MVLDLRSALELLVFAATERERLAHQRPPQAHQVVNVFEAARGREQSQIASQFASHRVLLPLVVTTVCSLQNASCERVQLARVVEPTNVEQLAGVAAATLATRQLVEQVARALASTRTNRLHGERALVLANLVIHAIQHAEHLVDKAVEAVWSRCLFRPVVVAIAGVVALCRVRIETVPKTHLPASVIFLIA